MENILKINWIIFKISLCVSIPMFILKGFDFMAFSLTGLFMFISILVSLLFWKSISNIEVA